MWVQAEYLPASLFTLKLSLATSSGARTLLVPTPFAIKTALVDAALRTNPDEDGEALTRALVGRTVAIRPCRRATVTNLFARVLKPKREDAASPTVGRGASPATDEQDIDTASRGGGKGKRAREASLTTDEQGTETGPYGRTIAYREYVHLDGVLGVAIEVEDGETSETLARLFPQINYFGRRGSFFQIMSPPSAVAQLSPNYIPVGIPQPAFAADGLIQVLDDWGPEMTFERLNIYSAGRIRMRHERVLHSTVLPYRRVSSSRSFTQYEVAP